MNHRAITSGTRLAVFSAMVLLVVLAAGARAGDCKYVPAAAVNRADALSETQNLLNKVQGLCDPNRDKKDDHAELFCDKLEIFKKNGDRDADKIKDDRKPVGGATIGEVSDLQRDIQGVIDLFKEYSTTYLEPVLGSLEKETTDDLASDHLGPFKGIKQEFTNFKAYIPTYIQKLEYAKAECVVSMKKDEAKRTVKNLKDALEFVKNSRDILRKQMEELAKKIDKVSDESTDLEESCGAMIADERRHREEEKAREEAEARIAQLEQQVAALSAGKSSVSTVRTGDPDDEGATPVGGQTPAATATPIPNPYAGMSTVDSNPGYLTTWENPYTVKSGDCLWTIAKAHCKEWGCDTCSAGCIETVLVPRLRRHIIRLGPKHPDSIWPGDLVDTTAMRQEQER